MLPSCQLPAANQMRQCIWSLITAIKQPSLRKAYSSYNAAHRIDHAHVLHKSLGQPAFSSIAGRTGVICQRSKAVHARNTVPVTHVVTSIEWQ